MFNMKNRAVKVSLIDNTDISEPAQTREPLFTTSDIKEVAKTVAICVVLGAVSCIVADTARQAIVKSVPTK